MRTGRCRIQTTRTPLCHIIMMINGTAANSFNRLTQHCCSRQSQYPYTIGLIIVLLFTPNGWCHHCLNRIRCVASVVISTLRSTVVQVVFFKIPDGARLCSQQLQVQTVCTVIVLSFWIFCNFVISMISTVFPGFTVFIIFCVYFLVCWFPGFLSSCTERTSNCCC
jgi:hypothetical protein